MRLFPRLSIRHRLTAFFMLLGLIAMVIVSVILTLHQRQWQTREMVQRFTELAGVVGANCAASLVFDDKEAAAATLKALETNEELLAATLYDQDGKVFAAFRKAQAGGLSPALGDSLESIKGNIRNLSPQAGFRFGPQRLLVWRPVTLEANTIGLIVLEVGLTQLRENLWGGVKLTLLIVLLAFLGTYPISLLFQKTLSRPILDLARLMRTISREENFKVRAEKNRTDELGDLIDCFNLMLEQIERRDRKLARQRDLLEEEVATRTAELSLANQQLEQAVLELSENEEHLNRLMEILDAGVVVADPASYKVVYVNSYAAAVLGVSREQVEGESCSRFFGMWDQEQPPTATEGAVPVREEDFLINYRGEVVPILKSVVPIQRQGRPYLLMTFFDLTAIKRTQEELKQSKEAAEAASRAKSQFLANMSHELRTPLNGVLGMTELLLTTSLTPQQRRFVMTVRNSALLLMNILQDVLDFSRIEAGKLKLEELEFHLPQVVEEVVEMFSETAHAKGLEYLCAISPEVPRLVRGDPLRLRQVLMNLLSNAVKFTEQGEVVTQVSVREGNEETVTILFEVRDTGVGIDPEAKKFIFEDFYQADGSPSRKFGGTGLGLAIAKRLTALLGGEIGLESEPGRGSRFWFTAALKRAADRPEAALAPDSLLKGIKVLVVDDNPTSRFILKQQLSQWGMVPQGVGDAWEALAVLREAHREGKPFEAALIGEALPGLDGMSLPQAIRGDATLRDIRVLMLMSPDATAQPPEADAWLSKPVRPSQLYNALLGLVRRLSGREGEPLPPPPVSRYEGRVLVAEDNPVNQEVVKALLEYLGCEVEVAASGRQALDALQARSFDLIFMDCQMPDMDGYEAVRAIRLREQEEGIENRTPIIALTAHTLEGDRDRCLAAGMDDFLGKPFTQAELQAVLEKWLRKGRAGAAGPPVGLPLPAPAPACAAGAASSEPPGEGGCAPQLDPRRLADLRLLEEKGNPGMVATLVHHYLTDAARWLPALQEAAATGEPEVLRQAAHRLKSGSANLGATALAELLGKLEALATQHQALEEGEKLVAAILQEYQQVQAALQKFLPPEAKEEAQDPEAAGPLVLVVDDDPATRLLIRAALTQHGFRVEEAEDGAAALAQVETSPPDLVLLDVLMPGLDGYQTLQHLRNLPAGENLPVVMVTGLEDLSSITRAYQAGATDFLTKPINPSLLCYRVQFLLRACQAFSRQKSLEEQLHQSQKLEAVGRLAGGVAHDFNNILTVIVGSTELLLDELPETNPHRGEIQEIQEAARKAASLTQQLLAFSRKQLLCPQTLDLNLLVENLEKMLKRVIGEDIELVTRLAPEPATVKADPGQLELVVMNLAINARDAMPYGGRLTLEVARISRDEGFCPWTPDTQPDLYVMLAVSDTGVGMDKETQARAFEPFFTTKEVGKGSGLGLAMVHGIVTQSGGHLRLDSQPGKGTTVKIFFPPAAPEKDQGTERTEEKPCTRGQETVLLVEDDPQVRRVASRMLKSLGYNLLEATSGREALALGEQHPEPIHLLFTDIVMPDMNGRQLAGSWQQLHPESRVLFTSGYSENAIAHHGTLDPGLQFIPKPYRLETLARKLRQVLQGEAP